MSPTLRGLILGLALSAGIFGAAWCGGPEAVETVVDVAEGGAGLAARRGVKAP